MNKQMAVTLVLALTVALIAAQLAGAGNLLITLAVLPVLWVLTAVYIQQHNVYERKHTSHNH